LRRLPVLDAIQHAAQLDMASVSGNGGIRHAQKALCGYPYDFETIEVLLSYLSKIRFNALWMFVAPIGPKVITFTSAAMKKKFYPSERILQTRRGGCR
jgi:hypothetical protein